MLSLSADCSQLISAGIRGCGGQEGLLTQSIPQTHCISQSTGGLRLSLCSSATQLIRLVRWPLRYVAAICQSACRGGGRKVLRRPRLLGPPVTLRPVTPGSIWPRLRTGRHGDLAATARAHEKHDCVCVGERAQRLSQTTHFLKALIRGRGRWGKG